MADNKVQTRQIGADVLVRSLDPEFNAYPTVYYMGNGRTFIEYTNHGAYLYDEYITDGDFDGDGSDWVVKSNLSGFGTGEITNTAASASLAQSAAATVVVSTTYLVTIYVKKLESGTISASFGGTSITDTITHGKHSYTVVAASTGGLSLSIANAGVGDVIIEKISVYKEP